MSSRTLRRVGVIIYYLSLFSIIAIAYFSEMGGWVEDHIGMLILSSIGITLLISYFVHQRTGLFKLTHTKVEKLDEREIQLIHNALRLSYLIFTIFTIITITTIGFGIQNRYNVLFDSHGLKATIMFNFYVLWSFAHTLPASILAWQEKEV